MTAMVDYAGLFPPAGLDLPTTLRNWRRYAESEDAWMLGRLIVPVGKLDELASLLERERCVPGLGQDGWRVSCLLSDSLDADIDKVFAFNRRFAPDTAADAAAPPESFSEADLADMPMLGGVLIDAIELKATSARQVDDAMRIIPEQLEPYFEVPVGGPIDTRGMIAAMAGTGARAKIRTGGVTPEAFPTSRQVAGFLMACAASEVPFKATAGLHHPVRAEYPLTYEAGCARHTMYGFLNVFLAGCLARMGVSGGGGPPGRLSEQDLVTLLEETNPRAFVFQDSGVTWRDKRLDTARLARARETFASSFGSCSFEEPTADLRSLGLL